MAALASVTDLEILMRVDPGTLQNVTRAAAEAALEFASELVRYEGHSLWGLDEDHPTPLMAKLIAIECAKRRFENPTGYTSETKGPFAYTRSDELAKQYLTNDEIRMLHGLANGRTRTEYAGSVRTPSPWHDPNAVVYIDPLLEFDLE